MKHIDLNNLNLSSGFTEPKNYFDDLENRIMQQLPKPQKKRFYKQPIVLWGSSIAAVLLCTIGFTLYNYSSEVQPTASDISEYLVQEDISSEHLLPYLNENDLPVSTDIPVESIENYLSESDIETYIEY